MGVRGPPAASSRGVPGCSETGSAASAPEKVGNSCLKVLTAMCACEVAHQRTYRPLPASRKLDADCHQGLEQLRGLLSHVDPHLTIGQLVGRIVQDALDRHDPSRPPCRARTGNRPAAGDSTPVASAKDHAVPEPGHAVTTQDATRHAVATPAPAQAAQPTPSSAPAPTPQAATERRSAAGSKPAGAVTPAAKPSAPGRAIPAAVKRQVWQRDGGRCSYVDRETGRCCNSRHLSEMDHILPYALGGGADPGNLRLRCRAHHRHRHAPDSEPAAGKRHPSRGDSGHAR